jgi:hypothetical protein
MADRQILGKAEVALGQQKSAQACFKLPDTLQLEPA